MISDAIIKVITVTIGAFISILPDSAGFGTDFTDAIEGFAGIAMGFNEIFPISEMLACLVVVITFEAAVLTFKTFNFIYNKIRGTS